MQTGSILSTACQIATLCVPLSTVSNTIRGMSMKVALEDSICNSLCLRCQQRLDCLNSFVINMTSLVGQLFKNVSIS